MWYTFHREYIVSNHILDIFNLDINECTDEPHLCTPMGTCMNMPGSFKCLCNRGFSLDPSGRFCMGKCYLLLLSVYIAS